MGWRMSAGRNPLQEVRPVLRAVLLASVCALAPLAAAAQPQSNPTVVPVCGTVPAGVWVPGGQAPQTVDTSGRACGSVTGGGGSVLTKPGPYIIVPLDIATVTTGGTAVVALSAGHATAGGFILTSSSAGLCVDQHTTAGTATGTPSTTSCVPATIPYNLVPSAGAVSVNSTGSSTALAGEGLQ